MQKTGKNVSVRRYEPDSSSSISSVSDSSSSVADGKWKTVVNRQAGLATKINICSLGNAPPNTNFASWNFDPDLDKAKKKKKKEKRAKQKERGVDGQSQTGFLSAELAGMDTTAMLKTTPNTASATTPNEGSATPATTRPTTASSMAPLFQSPSSVDHPGLHGEPLDSSESTDGGVPCVQGLLIGIMVLSVIGIIIVAYFAAIKYTTEEKPDRETQMVKHPDAGAILRMATKPYRLRHRTNGMKT